MRKCFRQLAALIFLCFLAIVAKSQTTISGNVKNSTTKEGVPSVSVTIRGSGSGTLTDEKGHFKLTTSQKFPLVLLFTSIGFDAKEVTITSASASIDVEMIAAPSLGVEVVVSASRVPERILESPVSIERVNTAAVRNTPATNYYDLLGGLKGVDIVASSLTFKTVTTRGFSGSGNTRLNQIVDGMDNQAPGLNFSVGSVIGLTELDVDNMELLPGASSALYGPGGMNGTLLINSKSPFKYQGFSFQVKQGIMHIDKGKDPISPAPYYDWSFRWGKKISEKFAFKINAQFVQAKDWIATDSTNYSATAGNPTTGTRASDPNYNGVNVYGDETTTDLYPSVPVAYRPLLPAGTTSLNVSRTGYREQDIINNNTVNFKVSGGLYYKLTERLEASLVGYWATGNTVYTGSDRYSLRNLKMGQYKVELKHDDWFVRLYTTQENAGDSYNATVTTQYTNEAWKPSATWYNQYLSTYLGQLAGGASNANAHLAARTVADNGRPEAGSDAFKQYFDKVRSTPISKGGGRFLDRTNLYMAEGQYNFGNRLKFADVLIGGNWKTYVLNSEGTLFADTAGRININEYGGYIQLARSFFSDVVRLTASGRYDKNENFKGRFTPRLTAVFKVAKDHNIRASFQTAYRFPTTQNQWINLVIGASPKTILIGGLPQLRDFYKFNTNKAYTYESFLQGPTALKEAVFGEYKPETVTSYEVGYKGIIEKRLLIDVYGYIAKYKNFIGRTTVVQSSTGIPTDLYTNSSTRLFYSVSVNSTVDLSTYGYGAGIEYLLPSNFSLTANTAIDKLNTTPPAGFKAYYNTPKLRTNIGLANSGFGKGKHWGFNTQFRYQDSYYTESDFRSGPVGSFMVLDAQVSYKLFKTKSMIKLGGTNLFNHYYKTQYGNPALGGVYYVSFAYNVF
ncbi:MAG: TonB-dependent receptor [Chitinophagaceae bacterium]